MISYLSAYPTIAPWIKYDQFMFFAMDQRMNQHTERTWKLDFGHVVWQVHGSCCLGCLVGIIIEIHPRTARILDDLGVPRFWETRISMVGEKKTQTIEHHQPEWWNKSFWKWTLLCSDCLASYTFDVKIPWLLIQFGGCVNMITSFHSMVYHAIHAIEITIEITKLK